MSRKLTERQRNFIGEYLVDLNATAAYIRAGFSPAAASVHAVRLMKMPEIREAIEIVRAEQARRTGYNADRVLRELAIMGLTKLSDLVDLETLDFRTDVNPELLAAVQSVKVKRNADGSVDREIKLYDKIRPLEMLCKHLGIVNDKLHIEATLPIVIVDDLKV